MMNFSKQFETEDLLLRPMNSADVSEFIKITGDRQLWIYFTHDLSDSRMLKKWVEQSVNELASRTRMALSIYNKRSKSLIGSTSIGNISERDGRMEIGWTWLGRAFQGKGLNDQTKHVLLDYCFGELFCERVEFKTDVLNVPARNALKRIGAVEEGILRSHTLMTHNRRRDTIYYSILMHEWDQMKSKK